jgi:hypothetical protein
LMGRHDRRAKTSVFLRHQGIQDFDHRIDPRLDDALEAGRSLRFLNRALGSEPTPTIWAASSLSRPSREPAREGYRHAIDVRQGPRSAGSRRSSRAEASSRQTAAGRLARGLQESLQGLAEVRRNPTEVGPQDIFLNDWTATLFKQSP